VKATGFPKIYLPEILRILLRDESLAADVTAEMLASKTDSFSGSDLKRKISLSRK
jgi:SpoVK/Ycf46/Vps4 family AAA+-type ATPase